jgi:hypothetical protein
MEDLKKYMWWIIGGIAIIVLAIWGFKKKPSKKRRRQRMSKATRAYISRLKGMAYKTGIRMPRIMR